MSTKSEQPKEAMCFRFRWFDTLECLPEAELRSMLKAIRAYAKNDQAPEFTGLAAALWHEFKTCIDHDKKEYAAKCERLRENGCKGGRPRKQMEENETNENQEKPSGFEENQMQPNETNENQTEPKKPVLDLDLKKEIPLSEVQRKKDFSLQTSDEKVVVLPVQDFRKWSRESFIASVYAAIGKNPDFAQFREEFCTYWLEPDHKGRFRFALQKTWQTSGRLATWAKKAGCVFRTGRTNQTGQTAALSAAEQIRQLQEG